MKLYYAKGACSLVVRIILNDVGASFSSESVDLKEKRTENGDDFKKINPKGSVPTLELDNGEILTENAVILQYLAESFKKTNLMPSSDNFAHYRILESLNFITTEIHKGFSPLFNPKIPTELKETIFKPILKTKFAYFNHCLENKLYLHEHFSLPDAYLYVMIRWAIANKVDLNELSNIKQFYNELNQRKSVEDALRQEGLSVLSFEKN